MADDSQTEIVVAAAALVVSVIAFAATLMQCLQQYLGSARGYSHCNPKVMGKWARTKSRRFSLKELRFEVQFDAPVIFVCAPNNKKGPVPEADVYKLDGTEESLRDTWTTLNMSQRKDYEDRNRKERIHTSDNERASWTILLSAVQCMEKKSREWQEEEFGYQGSPSPPRASHPELGLPLTPPTLEQTHTLVVALQKKRKSWDTMPANITKPYATTTMCHLIEMLAALGVYWKVFDRVSDRYRAEGNGFMVLGDRVNDLGLMFSFQVNGMSRFTRNRVIPVDEIKELCFGWVPTIYRSTQDKRRLEIPLDVLDLSSLQLASRAEISETLTMIGCNNNVTKYFNTNRRFSHLFSLSFEILAMLAQTFHIEDTLFTFLPNPTPDRWDSKAVSLPKLLEAYELNFKEELAGRVPRNRTIVNRLKHHMGNIIRQYRKDGTVAETLLRFRALHAALDDTDEILTGRKTAARKKPEQGGNADPNLDPRPLSSAKTLERIGTLFIGTTKKSDASAKPSGPKKPVKSDPPGLNKETEEQQRRREIVQDVLRSHIQEVLRLLNEPDERKDQQTLRVPEQNRGRSRDPSPSVSSQFDDVPTFEDMDGASPDDRQHIMMDVYFKHIRRLVVPHATRSTDNRRAGRINSPSGRRASVDSQSSVIRSTNDPSPVATVSVPPQITEEAAEEDNGNPTTVGRSANSSETVRINGVAAEAPSTTAISTPLPSLAGEAVSHDDVWCTLVFRMICWLMLHDFNKLDKQVVKSELLGSRMPVYIS
ncbi:unnamed protein product [Clonostachys rosea]|uniref:Modin n=1 Tax=Bionectria ochroleuca TaxID=29856 RepID=A0ABY6TX24_BIOOC|nr:unnamed protein product [Clonostachys rosea]